MKNEIDTGIIYIFFAVLVVLSVWFMATCIEMDRCLAQTPDGPGLVACFPASTK